MRSRPHHYWCVGSPGETGSPLWLLFVGALQQIVGSLGPGGGWVSVHNPNCGSARVHDQPIILTCLIRRLLRLLSSIKRIKMAGS